MQTNSFSLLNYEVWNVICAFLAAEINKDPKMDYKCFYIIHVYKSSVYYICIDYSTVKYLSFHNVSMN